MKVAFTLLFSLVFSFNVFSQTGTAASPFTSLGNARAVTSAGIYYFNLGGVQFSTYVNNAGLVLVATDISGSAAGGLPQVTALTNTGRGVLSPAVLARLTTATVANISTSDGTVNSNTTNPGIISRIIANQTLHTGRNDLSINSGWGSPGGTRLRAEYATCVTQIQPSLNLNVFHPCGDNASLHWVPETGLHRLRYSEGEAPAAVRFNLWVGAVLVPLPVKLTDFNAVASTNNTVKLNWTTQVEVNSDYFLVERSADATQWSTVTKVNAQNNSNTPTIYNAIDESPITGTNFYRLKIVDLDGSIEYSGIVRANLSTVARSSVTVYPNPGRNKIYIEFDKPGAVRIFNNSGVEVTRKVNLTRLDPQHYTADFSREPKGLYVIKSASGAAKLLIE